MNRAASATCWFAMALACAGCSGATDLDGGMSGESEEDSDGGAVRMDTGNDAGGAGSGASASLPPPELGAWRGTAPIELIPSAGLPGVLSGRNDVHYGALSCGPHPENLFDLVVPNENVRRLPLVIYIHGGGFTSGTRGAVFFDQASLVISYLDAGFAFATIDYRSRDALGEGVRTSLQDSMVCIQYIRLHADELGIDPDRVIFAGGSAGAGTSLWLATTSDMADSDAGHPVLAMSTRPSGIVLSATQATYDIADWIDVVFSPEYSDFLEDAPVTQMLIKDLESFYGLDGALRPETGLQFLRTDPDLSIYRAAVDMLALMSEDDPPIYVSSPRPDQQPVNSGILNHHPFHARAIVETARAVGVEVVADVPALGLTPPNAETPAEFAVRIISRSR